MNARHLPPADLYAIRRTDTKTVLWTIAAFLFIAGCLVGAGVLVVVTR